MNTELVMSKPRDRTISKRPDGQWENKRNDASRASTVHRTQKAAQDAALAGRLLICWCPSVTDVACGFVGEQFATICVASRQTMSWTASA
jgi:hypothetical protein